MLKRIFKYLVGRLYKPLLAKYLSGTRKYRYKGIHLVIPPQVFHPAFFFSTKILLKYLDKQPLAGKSFLELGAGSGLIAFYAAKKGARVTASDINPVAVEYLQKNHRLNKDLHIDIFLSDLFTDIPESHFDIIAINPPYFKKNPGTEAEYAWYCGEHGQYFENLFRNIGPYLHKQSRVLIILSEVCDLDMIHRYAEKHGWLLKIVSTHQNILEKMFLYEPVPRQKEFHHTILHNEEQVSL
jgi:release factor glutamine methyltransferase